MSEWDALNEAFAAGAQYGAWQNSSLRGKLPAMPNFDTWYVEHVATLSRLSAQAEPAGDTQKLAERVCKILIGLGGDGRLKCAAAEIERYVQARLSVSGQGLSAGQIIDEAIRLAGKNEPDAMDLVPMQRWWWQYSQNLDSMLCHALLDHNQMPAAPEKGEVTKPLPLLPLLRDVEEALADLGACDNPYCTDCPCVLPRVRAAIREHAAGTEPTGRIR